MESGGQYEEAVTVTDTEQVHDAEQYPHVAAYWAACETAKQEPLNSVMRMIQMQVGQVAV